MGFFEEQDRARRATARLLTLYGLAVLAIVAAANLVVIPVYQLWRGSHAGWPVYAMVSVVTIAIIAAGTLEIVARLSIGEAELAQLLSGRRVPRGAALEGERRLINVVDEMALASGLAAPPVYVLTRERGINAFAAGRSPNHAIVVVTQGALDELSRDELQAVIAHEFSHILNGDIRLNLRAACVLQGIVFLSAIGRFMMRYYSGYGTEEGRRFFHLPLAVIGAGVFAIGLVGLPLARLIQGALSREREYLADACAVQYTRNADALCGALARIKAHRDGFRLLDWHAEAMAHMMFAAASHPPIESRMLRANPHLPPSHYFEMARKPPKSAGPIAALDQKPTTTSPKRATAVATLVATLGEPSAEALEHATGLLAYLPEPIRAALADPAGAQAVMLGCLLDSESRAREAGLGALTAHVGKALARQVEVLAPLVAGLDRAYRLPLVALALPVLRKDLDETARDRFLVALRALIEVDARVTVGEFVFATILESQLGPQARHAGSVRYAALGELAADCGVLLSLLAHASAGAVPEAFAQGARRLGLPQLALIASEALRFGAVSEALHRLARLAPLEKVKLIGACAEVVAADGEVRLVEHELVRAVCSALDCPMPPSLAALDARLLRK